MKDGDHCVQAISTKRQMEFVKTVEFRGSCSHKLNGDAPRLLLPFAVSLHFLPRRRAQSLSDARLSNPCRFPAMIAIECISNSTLAACLAPFFREIILAAFLNMCNAAENFFR